MPVYTDAHGVHKARAYKCAQLTYPSRLVRRRPFRMHSKRQIQQGNYKSLVLLDFFLVLIVRSNQMHRILCKKRCTSRVWCCRPVPILRQCAVDAETRVDTRSFVEKSAECDI